jgi:hypothetical protein
MYQGGAGVLFSAMTLTKFLALAPAAVLGVALTAGGVANAHPGQAHHQRGPAAFKNLPVCATDEQLDCFTPGPLDDKKQSDAHYTVLVDHTRVRYVCYFWVSKYDSEHFDICE